MGFELGTMAGRTVEFTIALLETNGVTPLVMSSTDEVRVKIGRGAETVLEVTSIAPTAHDSEVTIVSLNPGSCTLRLTQDDMADLCGAYDCEVIVCSASPSDIAAARTSNKGVLHVVGPPLDGDIDAA
jgi:hypothetical protein